MQHTVAVVGAGISGLTVTHEILERADRVPGGVSVRCLDAAPRPGGNIRTETAGGFVCEWGPNGFLDNAPATLDLVSRLGLDDRLVRADESAARRFVYRRGRLRKLPGGPASFLVSDILSPMGKLRVLAEPLRPGPGDVADESIYDFASRRIGREAARVLVDAMVAGIYAGDARRLSLRATFPKMWAMEHEHGGLVRAMLKRRRSGNSGGPAGPGGRLTSFRNGLEELPVTLARRLGDRLSLSCRVARVDDMGVRGFRVHLEEGAPLDTDAVVLACPAWFASGIVRAMDEPLATAMEGIPSAPLAVVHLGFDRSELPYPPQGFGFLVPRGQGLRMLGTLWSSSIFLGRAPMGKVLLTCMLGGAHDGEAVELEDDRLLAIVREELRVSMGITASPILTRIFRHPRGIPQYLVGHLDRLAAISTRLEAHPGLFACGNSYRGISVNSCVEEAPSVADAVIAAVGAAVSGSGR